MDVFFVKSNETGAARSAIMVGLAVCTQVMLLAYNQYSPATSIGWGVFISSTWGRYQLHRFYELFYVFPVAHQEYVCMTRFSKLPGCEDFYLKPGPLAGTYSPPRGGWVRARPADPWDRLPLSGSWQSGQAPLKPPISARGKKNSTRRRS